MTEGATCVMDNWKDYMKDRLQKLKSTTSQLMSESASDKEEPTTIQLNPQCYDMLRELAERQNTTVLALINQAISQYIDTHYVNGASAQISLEQKERNPLFQLDGLTRSRHHYNGDGGMST